MNKIYLAGVIGMLVGLIALGAVAIDQAYQMRKEMKVSYPPHTKVPSLYILVDEDKLALHNGGFFLKVEKGESVSIALTVKSQTDKTLHPELSITYGPGNEELVLPEGINAEFNPRVIDLLPRHESMTNLTLHTDKDAPDGTYVIAVTAYDKKNNEGVGNGFTLVVGKGSRFYMGPTGPIGPAPNFERITNPPSIGYEIRAVPDVVVLSPGESREVLVKIWNLDPVDRNLTLYLATIGVAPHVDLDEAHGIPILPEGITSTFEKKLVTIPPIPSKDFYKGPLPDEKAVIVKMTIATSSNLQPGVYELGLDSYAVIDNRPGIVEIPFKLIVRGSNWL